MTDNINPEYQHPPQEDTAPVPTPEKKGNGLALLALLVGAFGVGVSIYNFQQARKNDPNYADGQDNPVLAQLEVAVQQQAKAQQNFAKASEVSQLSKEVSEVSQQISALNELSAKGAGVDKKELETMISNAIAASQLTPEQIKEMAGQSVSEEQVKALINQSLTQLAAGDQKIDLSKEISEIQAIATDAQAAAAKAQASVSQLDSDKSAILQSIDEKVKGLDKDLAEKSKTFSDSIDQKIATLQQTIGKIDTTTVTNPEPLLNALKLAQIAASNGNFAGAKSYLDQAEQIFSLFGLANSPYAEFEKEVIDLRSQYSKLAAEKTPATEVNHLITTVAQWPFKEVKPTAKAAQPAEDKGEVSNEPSWVSTVKGVGKNILDNTIRVTPIDDAGLVWINANEALQNVIRENVRLDLAFARNALQLGDYDAYAAIADQTQTNISHYFDTDNGEVAAALNLLANLKNHTEHGAEIGKLIQSIEQAK